MPPTTFYGNQKQPLKICMIQNQETNLQVIKTHRMPPGNSICQHFCCCPYQMVIYPFSKGVCRIPQKNPYVLVWDEHLQEILIISLVNYHPPILDTSALSCKFKELLLCILFIPIPVIPSNRFETRIPSILSAVISNLPM